MNSTKRPNEAELELLIAGWSAAELLATAAKLELWTAEMQRRARWMQQHSKDAAAIVLGANRYSAKTSEIPTEPTRN